MKKAAVFLLFLSLATAARAEPDCRKIFDEEMYRCLTDSGACQEACQEQTKKPDGSLYLNSGEIYPQCIEASDCDGKSTACNEQALVNFRACGQPVKEPETAAAKPGFIFPSLNLYRSEVISVSPFTKAEIEAAKTTAETKSISPAFEEFMEKLERFKPMTDAEFNRIWDSRPADKGYWWGPDSGAVIDASSWEEIQFKPAMKDDQSGKTIRMVKLGQGETEVKVKNADPQTKFGVESDWLDLVVIETHFWISQNQAKNAAMVAVYEGKVEIKTKDGQTVTVQPQGGQPGVVVIGQKLSPAKLLLPGLALVVIVGAGLFLWRRKR